MVCNTIKLLNILGKKWDAAILEEINEESGINFDKLLAMNPRIYPKTLNNALKDLVNMGFVTKEIYRDKIKHSRYFVNMKGKEALEAFEKFKKINCTSKSNSITKCVSCEKGPNHASNTIQ